MNKYKSNKVWFITEVFYPEDEGASYYLSEVAYALGEEVDTNVICSQPKFFKNRPDMPSFEKYKNINIYRCKSSHGNRHSIFFRLLNSMTFCFSVFIKLLYRLKKNDIVLCGCYPPILIFATTIACSIKGATHVLWLMDIHPDIAQAVGLLSKNNLFFKLGKYLKKLVFDASRKIIVIGRDMKEYLVEKYDVEQEKIDVIPLFIDTNNVFPDERNKNEIIAKNELYDDFVIGIAGNLGAVHDIDLLVNSAKVLMKYDKIKFLIIGSGKKKEYLIDSVKKNKLSNFIFEDWMPRAKEKEIGNACDVAISALYIPGLFGLACASRTTSITATGKPMIAVIDKNTEISSLIEEYNIGWRVDPGDTDRFIETIELIYKKKSQLKEYSKRARRASEIYFNSKLNIPKYVNSILNTNSL